MEEQENNMIVGVVLEKQVIVFNESFINLFK
jgi:hypothetical protein